MDIPELIKECYNENNEIFWQCLLCLKNFNNIYNAIRHTKNKKICNQKTVYICKKCLKKFVDKTKYNLHLGTKKCGELEEKTKCEVDNVMEMGNNLDFESFGKLFIDECIYKFWKYIYSKIDYSLEVLNYDPVLKTKNNLLIENSLKFISQLGENDGVQNFYSLIFRKLKKLDEQKFYIFYLIIKNNIEYLKNKNVVNIWNERLYNELITDITKNNYILKFS